MALTTGIAADCSRYFRDRDSDIVESLKGRSVSTGRSHARFHDVLVAAVASYPITGYKVA